jgi:DNA-binding NtrC family response regulator
VPTRGASFTIELPFQPAASADFSMNRSKTASGKDGHILLVDQDDSVLEAVGTILRGRDHRVDTAKDLPSACALIEKLDFDVIVADLQVTSGPNGDGLGAWLAQNRPALLSKLIWMSAVAPAEAAVGDDNHNSAQILQKPFKVSDLLAAIDGLLLSKVDAAPIGG